MITVVAIMISLLIVVYSATRGKTDTSKSSEYENIELLKYYESSDKTPQELKKILFLAAVALMERLKKVVHDKYRIYVLADNQVLGYDFLAEYEKYNRELETEKMEIRLEADHISENWSARIFEDAERYLLNLKKTKSVDKKAIDPLFCKKRDVFAKKVSMRLNALKQIGERSVNKAD